MNGNLFIYFSDTAVIQASSSLKHTLEEQNDRTDKKVLRPAIFYN
uniref:Uncharacterized protein n=1 Tax=uncultured Desulfobacterium sp. TaxID=201089 RepID=E1YDP7_9BACT|nr:unknown protein [uncultured Desulfobacterium sp.]